MRVAAVQLNSNGDKARNLGAAERLVRTAASGGAELVALPAEAPEGECFVAAELDLAAQERIREQLPSLASRRPHAYRWPQLMEAHA